MFKIIESFWFGFIGIFVSGMVATANLTVLIEGGQNYDAAWWRVGLAAFIGIGCWCIERQPKKISSDRYPMCKDQPAQIDCRVIECKKHGKGACRDISPALTLNPDKSYVCWSMEVGAPLPIKGE